MKVGDCVEAGWICPSISGTHRPPRGVIVERMDCLYLVKWENGYSNLFTDAELRMRKPAASSLDARTAQLKRRTLGMVLAKAEPAPATR